MKNILVTGGAGFIGSHVVEILVKKKFNVFIVDNLSTGHKRLINKNALFFKNDINQSHEISKIIKSYAIDSIIHLAAKTNIIEAEKKPKIYFKNNVLGTSKLIKICKKFNIRNFIFSSSCAVYGNKINRVKENSKTYPKGVYAITKLKCEKLIKKNFKKKNYAILRYFNVVGASLTRKIGQINKADQLFKNLSLVINNKKPIFNIYGNDYDTFDGTCIRDFIHVSDLADIHFKILKKISTQNKSVVLNCGYGRGFSVLQTMLEFKKFTKKKIEINFKKRRKGDIVEMVANVDKLRKFLNWKPKFYSLSKMVKSSIDWEKKFK